MRHRLARLVLAASVAVIGGLAFASPASADLGPITLNPAHVGATAAGFQQECTGPFKNLADGVDGWHFVLPAVSGDSFKSVELTFTKPDNTTVTVHVTSTDPAHPDTSSDPYWSAYIDDAGNSGDFKHVYVLTTAGWKLSAGIASVENYKQGEHFNLSHTCSGTPTTGTPTPGGSGTPTPGTSETPSPGTSTPPGGTPSPSTSSTGGLPVTGVAWGATALTAVGLIAAGIALMAVRRRRELTEDSAS